MTHVDVTCDFELAPVPKLAILDDDIYVLLGRHYNNETLNFRQQSTSVESGNQTSDVLPPADLDFTAIAEAYKNQPQSQSTNSIRKMRPSAVLLLPLASLITLAHSQAAAGGGVAPATTIQASQDATVRQVGSIYTVNGQTSVTQIMFTQTFAATALGTWAFGPTPKPGAIGLGDIQGEVGKVKGDKKGGKVKRGVWGSWGF